jgi:DNA polymerase-3 subunit delta
MPSKSASYVIVGEDNYIKEREIEKLRSQVAPKDIQPSDLGSFSPGTVRDMIDFLSTVPFLSEKRVAILREFQDMSKAEADAVLAYLKMPSPTGILIAAGKAPSKKDESLTGVLNEIVRASEKINARRPTLDELRGMTYAYFKRSGINIDEKAVELILRLKGDDPAGINGELEKLEGYAAGGKLTAADVEVLVTKSMHEAIFMLTDYIEGRDALKAYDLIADLYDQKKNPVEIIGYIAKYFHTMQVVKFMALKGAGAEKTAQESGLNPGYLKKLIPKSRRYSIRKLDECMRLLYEADRDIKSGRRDDTLAVDMLIASLVDMMPDQRA